LADEQHTCKATLLRGKTCGREQYDGDKCICHSPDPEKDTDLFQHEVDGQLERSDFHDFTGFVFPEESSFGRQTFRRDVYFLDAQFLGEADFHKAEFSGKADFSGVRFNEGGHFQMAQFSANANFFSARFSDRAGFWRVRFAGEAAFMAAQFSGEAKFNEAQFSAKANFVNAQFHGAANFVEVHFSGQADFRIAPFHGKASFKGSRFFGEVDFYRSQFLRVASFEFVELNDRAQFRYCKFCGDVSFSNTILTEKARMEFDNAFMDGAAFQGVAGFASITMYEGAVLQFRKISIETCRFLETDLRKVHFNDVTWTNRDHRDTHLGRFDNQVVRRLLSLFVRRRQCVFDELAPDTTWIRWNAEEKKTIDKPASYQYPLIAQLYRHLQSNFMDSNRYSEAGDFYIGEQEMMRKQKGPRRQFFCVNMLYKLVSNYGQSFGQPLALLAAVLLLFPAILLLSGINAVPGQTQNINYDIGWGPCDFAQLMSDYGTVAAKNISFLRYNRSELTDLLTSPWQGALAGFELVLVIVLIAFFLLALRRQFKRRSF
jgi:uncharacterized protein YjbI with pentapeptide repeats